MGVVSCEQRGHSTGLSLTVFRIGMIYSSHRGKSELRSFHGQFELAPAEAQSGRGQVWILTFLGSSLRLRNSQAFWPFALHRRWSFLNASHSVALRANRGFRLFGQLCCFMNRRFVLSWFCLW